jgi:D-ribulokinase
MQQVYVGVDVGTSSARAGVFDEKGKLLGTAKHPITTWHEAGDVVEQSSSDIWGACTAVVRAAMLEAAVAPDAVKGIGFDATCSLVVLAPDGAPVSVSGSDDARRNVIVWMDHRAVAEAREINDTQDDVLRYVGGSISPEMEIPKLLWLKRNRRETFDAAGHFFDLADFLSFRATGSLARSMCTVACKWNFLAHEKRWSAPYFQRVGLDEFVVENYARIGTEIVAPGSPLAAGLTPAAAKELGLPRETPVGAALIDAHAGGIGAVGGRLAQEAPVDVCRRLAYIMGTSACIMATTSQPRFVPGVWGPYYSGMVPGFWLNEGGQSAAGAAVDHLLRSHPAFVEVSRAARSKGIDVIELLEQRILARVGSAGAAAALARDIHVLPEFLGNRSPYADPDSRAVIAGLDLDADIGAMERLFVAGLCGLAYGLADVIDAFAAHKVESDIIVMGGGASRSPLVRQIMADTTGLRVALPQTQEPVLLGAAMLGAVAGGAYRSIGETMASMSALGRLSEPTAPGMAEFHRTKRSVHVRLRALDRESRDVMRRLEVGSDRQKDMQ